MKSFYLITTLLAAGICAAQPFPVVTGFTITPEEPTELNLVMMIAEVETPFQGHRLDRNQHVSHADFRVDLTACYYSGTTGTAETHIDTFYIGFLEHGYYAVSFKATLSDQAAYCHLVDSSQESTFLQVGPSSSVDEWHRNRALVFPNPCFEYINVPAAAKSFIIRCNTGAIVDEGKTVNGIVSLDALPPGIYSVEIILGERPVRARFVKRGRN